MDQNGSKWIKLDQNDLMDQIESDLSKMGRIWSKWIKLDQMDQKGS